MSDALVLPSSIPTVHPDPAKDYIGYLNWLGDQIISLQRERAERRVSASEAAEVLGFDRRYFHGKPWRIPGFGLSGYLHSIAVWSAWILRPETERRAEWEAMSERDRKAARGLAS